MLACRGFGVGALATVGFGGIPQPFRLVFPGPLKVFPLSGHRRDDLLKHVRYLDAVMATLMIVAYVAASDAEVKVEVQEVEEKVFDLVSSSVCTGVLIEGRNVEAVLDKHCMFVAATIRKK